MSSRLGLPPSLLALVFLTSSLILTSAIQPREIKSLPNPIILAPNERVRFWADDYFAGYNLTFDLNGRFARKIRALENSPFNTKSALDSSKSFQTSDGKLITAYLHADLKVTVVPYEDGKLSTSFQVPIAKAKICYDLEFLSQDVIVVDCNMEDSQKTFTFISLKTKKVIKTANNDELFKRHSRRKLRAANGFNGADLISLISSDDTLKNRTAWQINFIKFDNNNNIDTVTKVSADNIDELADFELSDVLAVSSTELLITGANYLYLAKRDDDNFLGNLVLYPLNDKENANAFSTLQSSGPLLSTLVTTDSTAYEVLRSQEGGYLEVADIFVDSIYRLAGNVQIEYAQLTQDFAIFVTTGARPSLYIFKRGDTKANDIFYVNYISDFQFDEPVKLLAHYDKNVLFWITDSGVQTLGIQEVWLEIINDKPSEPKTIPLRVCSEGNCVTQNIELVSLDKDDYHIYQLNKNELKFVKTYNETLEIAFDDLFAAPHINYELNSAEGDRLPVPDYIEIGLSVGNMPTEFVSIDYDEENKKFRLHIQEEGKDTLDLYLCNMANMDNKDTENPPYLNCDKKVSDTISGKVRKVYAEDPVMDIIEIVNEKNLRNAAVGTKKLSKGLISYYYDCDVIYKSYDNHVESNTFCAKGNNITINTNSSYVGVDHILLEDSFKPKQILTHPAFPGLLFISNSTAISIINSEFYLGPHYGHDIATINTISVPNDPDFRFVVTSSHIVIFLPKNDSISEFEITNPLDIIFNKQYMLHGSKLIVNEKTIAYSQTTDLIYTIIGIPFVDDVYFLLVLEPNGIGNANFKYVFNTTYVKDLSKYTLSVTNLDSETDLVLHGASGGIKGFIVGKEAKITFTGNYMADSELFAERSFVITAKNPFTEEVSTKDAKIYFINTQRSIKPLEGDADLKMELSFRNDTKILFKESDLFSGPAFRWSINKEVETDNIDLIPRVHSNEILGSSAIPNNITDISYNNRRITRGKIFLLEDEGKKIHTYESADFPAPESKRQSPELHGLGGKKADLNNKCYQVESDPNQIYIAALCYDDAKSAAYIDVININDNSLNYQLITPTENTRTIYKVVSNYLFYTTRDSYNAIYVYKISQDKANLKVDLLRIVTRDDLTIGRRDNITDMDGFMLRSGQTGVFVATGSTGFNYLFIENDNIKISSYPNFLSLFANDHLQAYNNAPVFHALALLRRAATDSSETFTLILSSKNAFSYKLSVVTDRQGNINNVQVLEGYIQYQNYRWLEMVAATADTVVLMGFIPGAGPNGFGPGPLHYFFYDQKAVPTLNTSYPLYDAFQVLPAEGQFTLYEKPLHLLIRRRGEELLYIRNKLNFNGITGGLKEYRIEDTFSLETPASRVSSSYVDLIAANDFWSNSIRIPVQNYGNILPGVSPGKIILFVFGGLGLAFIIAAVLIKVFSNKEKKQLKDTDFARPGETTQQTGETDASQYFKIED